MNTEKMSHSPLRAAILTLGCRVNQYESRAVGEALAKMGFVLGSDEEICDLYLINPCAVTAESDRKSRQLIRRCLKSNPRAVVVAFGCSAQLHSADYTALDGLDFVGGSTDKLCAAELGARLAREGRKNPAPVLVDSSLALAEAPFDNTLAITGFDRTRAYVKIEDGCDANCAYCIIPAVRGHVRSRPKEDILREIGILAEGGCAEVVLTGIETSAYREGLTDLIRACAAIDGIRQIRLGSMDPSALRPAFADEVAGIEKFMPHIHVSLQSGCSRTLAAMRRKYNVPTLRRNLTYLRQMIPGMQFTADVICGFPGETEADFAETMDFCREIRFYHLHIFPYSRREGTPAAVMPEQIPEPVKADRAARLDACQRQIRREIHEACVRSGQPLRMLPETAKNGLLYGHSREFFELAVPGDPSLRGRLVWVMPEDCDDTHLYGRVIPDPTHAS